MNNSEIIDIVFKAVHRKLEEIASRGDIEGSRDGAAAALRRDITLDDRLADDLYFDSLDVVEFVMCLEEELDITISTDDADKIETVEDAVNICIRYYGER